MSGSTSKLLRKIAKLQGRTDKYIKREFKHMSNDMQQAYLAYMKENLVRIEALRKSPQKETVVLDQPIRKEG